MVGNNFLIGVKMHTFRIVRLKSQGFQNYNGFIRAKNFETIRDRFFKGCEIQKGGLTRGRYHTAEFFLNGKRVGRADYMTTDLPSSGASPEYKRALNTMKKKVSASFQVKRHR